MLSEAVDSTVDKYCLVDTVPVSVCSWACSLFECCITVCSSLACSLVECLFEFDIMVFSVKSQFTLYICIPCFVQCTTCLVKFVISRHV